jgi:hypothetical protein
MSCFFSYANKFWRNKSQKRTLGVFNSYRYLLIDSSSFYSRTAPTPSLPQIWFMWWTFWYKQYNPTVHLGGWASCRSAVNTFTHFQVSVRDQKPNSWTYNFVEISRHNLESSQAWGFCMDFLNHREGGTVFYQVFLLSPLQRTVTAVTGL